MKTFLKTTLLFYFLFLGKIFAQNQPPSTRPALPVLQLPQQMKDSIPLRPYLSVFVDSTNLMSLQNAQNQHFILLSDLPLGQRGCEIYKYWYRFVVENPSLDTVKLSLSFIEIFSLTAFSFDGEKRLDSVTVGKLIRPHPQTEKTAYPSNRTLLLYFPPKTKVTVWLKATKSWCEIAEQPVLCNPSVEARFHYKTLLGVYAWNFTFLGILLFMMIQALTHYFLQKQKAFLFYFLYIFSHFVFYWWVFEREDQFLHILPTFILDHTYRTPIATSWSIFYALFLEYFFDAKRKMPQLHRWVNISIIAFLGLVLIDVILLKIDIALADAVVGICKKLLTILGAVLIIYMLWVFRKSVLANYILVGTFLFVLGSLYIRVVPETSFYWEDDLIGQQIGIILELIFFSIGLAYKSRLDTIEKEQLAVANQKLSLENAVNTLEKERLILEMALKETQIRTEVALDIHDKVGAELSKMSLAAQNDSNLPNTEADFFKKRIRFYGKEARVLAGKMREIIFAIDPEYNHFEDMQAYFREQSRVFWADLNVEIVYDFDGYTEGGPTLVSTHLKRHLLPIFTEAQNNAAKYAQTKTVYLTFKLTSHDQYLLEIRDEGIGFDLAALKPMNGKIKGIAGIRYRADLIGADCIIRSIVGQGTTIRIVGAVKAEKTSIIL